MANITPEYIKSQIVEKLSEIGYLADESSKNALIMAKFTEDRELPSDIVESLLKNIEIASQRNFPLCQDTGTVVFLVKIGNGFFIDTPKASVVEYHHEKYILETLIYDAVKEAFQINNFRHSIVSDPINRRNTKDNTPPIIHYEFTTGDLLEISMMLKGGGSENMSALKMMIPSDGLTGIRNFVLDTIKKSGSNGCPPLTVGIGIGGNFETCALLAKKSLFRDFNEINKDEFWANEERYLLNKINQLGIGPMGLGGKTTAIKVNIEVRPCHIASLPVAVNLECHAHRIGRLIISNGKLDKNS